MFGFLFLFLSLQINAWGKSILITYDQSLEQAWQTEKLLREKYFIPESFIEVRRVGVACSPIREKKSWHLCINNDEDLQEVFVDKKFTQETIRIFL